MEVEVELNSLPNNSQQSTDKNKSEMSLQQLVLVHNTQLVQDLKTKQKKNQQQMESNPTKLREQPSETENTKSEKELIQNESNETLKLKSDNEIIQINENKTKKNKSGNRKPNESTKYKTDKTIIQRKANKKKKDKTASRLYLGCIHTVLNIFFSVSTSTGLFIASTILLDLFS